MIAAILGAVIIMAPPASYSGVIPDGVIVIQAPLDSIPLSCALLGYRPTAERGQQLMGCNVPDRRTVVLPTRETFPMG